MLFKPSSSCLSLALTEADGTYVCSLDIHPERWLCKHSLDDAICTYLADLHDGTTAGDAGEKAWFVEGDDAYVNHDTHHPDFTILTGGVVRHTGRAITGALPVRASATHITLPDGTAYERARFSPPPHAAHFSNQSYEAIQQTITTPASTDPSTPMHDITSPHFRVLLGLTVGLAKSLDGYDVTACGPARPYLWAQTASLVGARLALIHSSVQRAGQTAQDIGTNITSASFGHITRSWALRPQRAWMPERWVSTETLDTWSAQLDPVDTAAGKALGTMLGWLHTDAKALERLHNPISAHDHLAAKTLTRRIDAALLSAYAGTPERLKPRARHRAKALTT